MAGELTGCPDVVNGPRSGLICWMRKQGSHYFFLIQSDVITWKIKNGIIPMQPDRCPVICFRCPAGFVLSAHMPLSSRFRLPNGSRKFSTLLPHSQVSGFIGSEFAVKQRALLG